MLRRIVNSRPLLRGAAIVLPAAILATAFAVVPSFAVTRQFLTTDVAARLYLTKGRAQQLYAKKRQIPKVPAAPISDSVASTALFGPVSSTTAVDVPGSGLELSLIDNRLVDLTFSGVSSCTASTDGVPCQVSVLVDGQPASTGKVALDASGNQGPAVHTLTQTAFLSPGDHTISVQYAGSSDPSVNFTLKNWNLVYHAFPAS